MNRRIILATAILAAASGCTGGAFAPDGPQQPLTTFDRIDIRPLQNKIPGKGGAADPTAASVDSFLQAFRKDMTSRLQKKQVLNLTNGPMVVLDATLLKYECESRPPSYEKDNLTAKAAIEIKIVLTDETGKRVGGGKASVEYKSQSTDGALKGAEKRVIAAIGEYLRKSSKGKGPDGPDPDDPP